MGTGIALAERGLLPDFLIKYGIQKLLDQRLKEMPLFSQSHLDSYKKSIVSDLKTSQIAIETKAANEQHYEVPPEFFKLSLGHHLKYSSCFFEAGAQSLDQAEADMLSLTVERAGIQDGMKVLDLGCGWGSLSLWLAEHFPRCEITSVSNSHQQREYIESKAKSRGYNNIKVITADINEFDFDQPASFDRIVSVEMFEHMRNYQDLFNKVASWLKDDGKLFVHIFCHDKAPYYFETEGDDNWMGAYFFTGGIMPSADLFRYFDDRLKIDKTWKVNGVNYQKTALGWLDNIDKNKNEVLELFTKAYGADQAKIWFNRWRIFFLSCAELFGYKSGNEWYVNHYLFSKNG